MVRLCERVLSMCTCAAFARSLATTRTGASRQSLASDTVFKLVTMRIGPAFQLLAGIAGSVTDRLIDPHRNFSRSTDEIPLRNKSYEKRKNNRRISATEKCKGFRRSLPE